jgi:hypothetical protein
MKFTHTSIYSMMTILILWCTISSVSALSWLTLSFPGIAQNFQAKFFPVSFKWWWNNYAGSLIIKIDTSSALDQKIIFGTWTNATTITCQTRIGWYYFNTARGLWLLPLSTNDQNTSDNITVDGGIFTNCDRNPWDIIGALTYKKNGVGLGRVIFWAETNLSNNSYSGTYSTWAVTMSANKISGRFFDTMFGIWIIDYATGAGEIGEVSNLMWTLTKVYVQWHAGLWQSISQYQKEVLTTNLAGTKTLLTSADEITASTVISTVAKNTAKQCRWNTIREFSIDFWTKKFVCLDLGRSTYTIDKSKIVDFVWRDVVFLNGNVFLDKSIYTETSFSKPLSIYIPNGNLIFDSNIDKSLLTNVDTNGFSTNPPTTVNGGTKWMYLVGNFIVNGIILWSTGSVNATYTTIPFKTFIHGKLSSLNTLTTVSDKRMTQLKTLLNTEGRVWPNYSSLSGANSYFGLGRTPSLWHVFSWRCYTEGTWALLGFWIPPIGSFEESTVDAVKSITCPQGHEYPLMIIERDIPTSFFNK